MFVYILALVSGCGGQESNKSVTNLQTESTFSATSAAGQVGRSSQAFNLTVDDWFGTTESTESFHPIVAQVWGNSVNYSNAMSIADYRTKTIAYSGKLTDTGVSTNYCNGLGSAILVDCVSPAALALNSSQDGMVGRDVIVPANTDGGLGFSYSLVPKLTGGNYDKTECVKDNVTGLIWEGKPEIGFRTTTNTYTNYDSDAKLQKYLWISSTIFSTIYTYVFPTLVEIDAPSNTEGYKTAVNGMSLCGFTDWRLPTADELHSLVNVATFPLPAIDNDWFPNTQRADYWTSSPSFVMASNAWKVSFWDGGVFYNKYSYDEPFYGDRHIPYFVRLVRGAATGSASRFTYGNGGAEVIDAQTNLIWRRCVEGMSWNGLTCVGLDSRYTREQALTQAQSQTGWRLPNVKELTSIVDRSTSSPSFNLSVFPLTPLNGLWTATPFVGFDTSIQGGWYVDGVSGASLLMLSPSFQFPIRLVKDGP